MNLKRIGKTSAQVLTDSNGNQILISYSTIVAAKIENKYYRTSKKWSVTTSRQINKWLEGIRVESRDQSFFDALANFQRFNHEQ